MPPPKTGNTCDKGYVLNRERMTCMDAPPVIPASVTTAPLKATNARDRQREKAKRDSDFGKRVASGAMCAADADCAEGKFCINKVCSPCGRRGAPCCTAPGRAACARKGGKGGKNGKAKPERAPLVCEYDATASANMCKEADESKVAKQQQQPSGST
jgi:hypothetical protein